MNILLIEYPAVADELKQVARDRASIASKGKCKSRSRSSASEHEADDDSAATNESNTSTGNPIETEIDRMVDSISAKLRKELKKTL